MTTRDPNANIYQRIQEIRDSVAALEMALLPGGRDGGDWIIWNIDEAEGAVMRLIASAHEAIDTTEAQLRREQGKPLSADPAATEGVQHGR